MSKENIIPELEVETVWIQVPSAFFNYLRMRRFGRKWNSWAAKALYNQLVADGDLIPLKEEYDGEPAPPPEDETPYMGEMPEPEEGTVFLSPEETQKMLDAEPDPKLSADFDEARVLRLHDARTKLVYDPTKRRRASATPEKSAAKGGINEK